MSIIRWMDKKLWYIYTVEYDSTVETNTFESVLMRWMNLEPITEWSESERKTIIIYLYVYMKSRKMAVMNLFTGQQQRLRPREQTYGCGLGEEGEAGTDGESNTEAYTLPCVKQSQWGLAAWLRGLKPGILKTWRGRKGWKVGGRFKRQGTHVYLWVTCWCMTEGNTILGSNFPSIKNK